MSESIITTQLSNDTGIVFTCSAPYTTQNGLTDNGKAAQDYIFTLSYNENQNANNKINYYIVQEKGINGKNTTKYTVEQGKTTIDLPTYAQNVTSMCAIGFESPNNDNYNEIILTVAFYDASYNSYLCGYNLQNESDGWFTITSNFYSNGYILLWSSIIPEKQQEGLTSNGTLYMIQTKYKLDGSTLTYKNSTILQVGYNWNNNNNLTYNTTTANNVLSTYQWYVPYIPDLSSNQVGYNSSESACNIINIYNPMIAYDYNATTFAGIVVTDVSKNKVNIIYSVANDFVTKDNLNMKNTNLNLELTQPITGFCINQNSGTNNNVVMYFTYENFIYKDNLNVNSWSTSQISKNDALQWIFYDNVSDLIWTGDNSNNFFYGNTINKLTTGSVGPLNYISGAGLLACSKESVSGTNSTTTYKKNKSTKVYIYNSTWNFNSNAAIAVISGKNQGLWWVIDPQSFYVSYQIGQKTIG